VDSDLEAKFPDSQQGTNTTATSEENSCSNSSTEEAPRAKEEEEEIDNDATLTAETEKPGDLDMATEFEEVIRSLSEKSVRLEKANAKERTCRLVLTGSDNRMVSILATFPNSYPAEEILFTPAKGSESLGRRRALRALRSVSSRASAENRACLQECIRELQSVADEIFPPTTVVADTFAPFEAINVPFPRTSGAHFCGPDRLVCFGRATKERTMSKPRAMSLSGRRSSPEKQGRFNVRKVAEIIEVPAKSQVAICKIQSPMCPLLARQLFLERENPSLTCKKNAAVTLAAGHPRKAAIWMAMAKMAQMENEKEKDWNGHPLCRPLLDKTLNGLVRSGDVQTAALIVCAFHKRPKANTPTPPSNATLSPSKSFPWIRELPPTLVEEGCEAMPAPPTSTPTRRKGRKKKRFWFLGAGALPLPAPDQSSSTHSPYHTISCGVMAKRASERRPLQTVFQEKELDVSTVTRRRTNRSSSWSELAFEQLPKLKLSLSKNVKEEKKYRVLSEDKESFYLNLKLMYAEVLSMWGLHTLKCKILKLAKIENDDSSVTSTSLSDSLVCSANRLSVRGLAVICPKGCGHGGHLKHWRRWFEVNEECPHPSCHCRCID